ncbi:apopolysialoglycoprotein [Cooperia oncophora]
MVGNSCGDRNGVRRIHKAKRSGNNDGKTCLTMYELRILFERASNKFLNLIHINWKTLPYLQSMEYRLSLPVRCLLWLDILFSRTSDTRSRPIVRMTTHCENVRPEKLKTSQAEEDKAYDIGILLTRQRGLNSENESPLAWAVREGDRCRDPQGPYEELFSHTPTRINYKRLAEESSLTFQPAPQPTAVEELRKDLFSAEDTDLPRYAAELESEESREASEATSGADQDLPSDAGSPLPLYERTSPQLEEQEQPIAAEPFVDAVHEETIRPEIPSRPLPSWSAEEIDIAVSKAAEVPSEPMLTQEELDHIAYIQRLAEETSFAAEPSPQPTLAAEGTGAMDQGGELTQEELDHIAYIQRLAEESSLTFQPAPQPTAVEELRKDLFSAEDTDLPRYAAELESEESREASEATSGADQDLPSDAGSPLPLYERTSPQLEEQEQPIAAEPFVDAVHEETIRPEIPSRPLPSWFHRRICSRKEVKTTIALTFSKRLAEETSFAAEPSPQPTLAAEGTGAMDQGGELTQEELDHIAYIQRLAEESSLTFQPAPQPTAVEELRKDLFSAEDTDLPRYAAELESEESREASEATSGADQDLPSDAGSPLPLYERTSPQLPLPSWSAEEIDIAVSKAAEVPSEPMLTQEELDHIAYIQRLAEETSFAAEPSPQPTLAAEGTGAMDQGGELTQEELDHIAYIQSARWEESSLTFQPAPQPTAVEELRKDLFSAEDTDLPRYAAELESEESREASEATSGADQDLPSDAGSPLPLYERTSPQLEEQEQPIAAEPFVDAVHEETIRPEIPSRPLPSWSAEEIDIAVSKAAEVPSEPMLTQEELDHIAYIQRLAEETSFAAEPSPQPTLAAEGTGAMDQGGELTQEELDHIAYIQRLAEESSLTFQPAPQPTAVEELRKDLFSAEDTDLPRYAAELESEESREEASEATSGADQDLPSDAGSPLPLYERTSPQLEEQEQPIAAEPFVDAVHEETIRPEIPSRPLPSWSAEEIDIAVSKAAEVPSEPMLTQEELDHIAYIQRLAEETSFAAEPSPQPTLAAEGTGAMDQGGELTQEELDHIAYIQRLAEESSLTFQPAPQPTAVEELRKDLFSAEDTDLPRYAAELESEESREASEATSGADQDLPSDAGSPLPLYERTSPQLEEQEQPIAAEPFVDAVHEETIRPEIPSRPLPSWSAEEIDIAVSKAAEVPSEPMLTQEELDHIAYIQRLAEETSFAAEPSPQPTLAAEESSLTFQPAPQPTAVEELRKDLFSAEDTDLPRYAAELESEESREASEATSGADQDLPSDAGSPLPLYERTSPQLEEQEQPIAAEPFVDAVHEETIRPEIPSRPLPSWSAEEIDIAVSKAAEVPSEPMLTQEELDHIAYIQRLAEETSFAAEPSPQPTLAAEGTGAMDQGGELTQEELDHIAYIQRLAEESSLTFQPAPQPTAVEELRKDLFSAEDTDLPRYAAELESEESREASEATSGADQDLPSDAGSPLPLYERTSPQLEEQEQPIAAEPFVDAVHEETIRPEIPSRPLPSWSAEEIDIAVSKAAEARRGNIVRSRAVATTYISCGGYWSNGSRRRANTRRARPHSVHSKARGRIVTHVPTSPQPTAVEELRKDLFSAEDTDLPRYAAELESEESREASEATSGADQDLPSDAGSPLPLYERTSPQLEEQEQPIAAEPFVDAVHEETIRPEIPSRPLPSWSAEEIDIAVSKAAEVPSEPMLTQEELDHIAYIQRLAEETSFAAEPSPQPTLAAEAYIQRLAEESSLTFQPAPQPTAVEELRKDLFSAEDTDLPRYAAELESEESREASEATSGADQDLPSDAGSPLPLYERTSPQLEEQEQPIAAEPFVDAVHEETIRPEIPSRPLPSWSAEEIDIAVSKAAEVPSEPMLTQEELDHIAYIQRLAEETSFAAEPSPQPTLAAEGTGAMDQGGELTQEELDHIAQLESEESREASEATSGADQDLPSDAGSPLPLYERTSPQLEEQEQPIAAEPFVDAVHEETIRPEIPSRPLPSWSAEEIDIAVSKAAEVPSEPMLTQEELDHIAYIQRLAEETSFAAEPSPQPTLAAEGTGAMDQGGELTQEELDHIAYIQRLAEESSLTFQPAPQPTAVEELRKDLFSAEDTDLPRYAAELEKRQVERSVGSAPPQSGADQDLPSDAGSPILSHVRTSPQLEEKEKEGSVKYPKQHQEQMMTCRAMSVLLLLYRAKVTAFCQGVWAGSSNVCD